MSTSNRPESVEVAEAAESGVVCGDATAAEDGGAALQLLLPKEVGVATLVLRVCAGNVRFFGINSFFLLFILVVKLKA